MRARKNVVDKEILNRILAFLSFALETFQVQQLKQNPQGQPRGGVLFIFFDSFKRNITDKTFEKNLPSIAWSGIRTHASSRIEDLKSSALTDSAIHALFSMSYFFLNRSYMMNFYLSLLMTGTF